MSSFLIPALDTCHEQVIKNSRFITWIAHAPDPAAAHRVITRLRAAYPDARHVCWAFIAGEPRNTTDVSCSDDGEPAGTAGKPMLNVLQHGGVGEVVAVVVRYFGGIKLGTGGLVRAYSSSVVEALKITPTHTKVALVEFQLQCSYALEDLVRRTLANNQAGIQQVDYGDTLCLVGVCPADGLIGLRQALADAGRGQIVFISEKN